MIIIRCPYCHEQRTEEELTYGGEADIERALEPESFSDQQWTEYLFMRSNPKGLLAEHWCCAFGCCQWFKVQRNSLTHEICEVVRFDEPWAKAAHAEAVQVERSDDDRSGVAPGRVDDDPA